LAFDSATIVYHSRSIPQRGFGSNANNLDALEAIARSAILARGLQPDFPAATLSQLNGITSVATTGSYDHGLDTTSALWTWRNGRVSGSRSQIENTLAAIERRHASFSRRSGVFVVSLERDE
jgi:hypothetical protein